MLAKKAERINKSLNQLAEICKTVGEYIIITKEKTEYFPASLKIFVNRWAKRIYENKPQKTKRNFHEFVIVRKKAI